MNRYNTKIVVMQCNIESVLNKGYLDSEYLGVYSGYSMVILSVVIFGEIYRQKTV